MAVAKSLFAPHPKGTRDIPQPYAFGSLSHLWESGLGSEGWHGNRSHVVSAFMGLLVWWLEAGLPCTATVMDAMFQRLTLPGVNALRAVARRGAKALGYVYQAC